MKSKREVVSSAKTFPGVVHGYIDVQKYLRTEGKRKGFEFPEKKEPDSLSRRVSVYVLQMKNEYLREIKIGDICKVFEVHPSFLSRKFKKAMDCTLQDFIHRIKIQRAVRLLQQDALNYYSDDGDHRFSLRIDDLAQRLGFSSPEYFIRCFKKQMGVSPGTYRKCFKLQRLGAIPGKECSRLDF